MQRDPCSFHAVVDEPLADEEWLKNYEREQNKLQQAL